MSHRHRLIREMHQAGLRLDDAALASDVALRCLREQRNELIRATASFSIATAGADCGDPAEPATAKRGRRDYLPHHPQQPIIATPSREVAACLHHAQPRQRGPGSTQFAAQRVTP